MLHLGTWSRKFTAVYRPDTPSDRIGIPEKWSYALQMPGGISFAIQRDGINLRLGPVVAILIGRRNLSIAQLEKYKDYLVHTKDKRGLVYLCSLSGVNRIRKTITGYTYHPNKDGNSRWHKSEFPYPDVAFRKVAIAKNKIYDDLYKSTNGRIFNPYFLSKWEFWNSIRTHHLIRENVPHTTRLNSVRTLNSMLRLHKSVYIKPIRGSGGRGIIKLDQTSKGFFYRNWTHQNKLLASLHGAWMAVKKKSRGRKHLIQQSVAMVHEDKNVDFRVIMQKDGTCQWICSGIIARYGKQGNVYTNEVSSLSLGREALKSVYHYDEQGAIDKEEEIVAVCKRTCHAIEEKFGLFGDIGFDVSIDSNRKVWILEINSCQQFNLPTFLPNGDSMHRTMVSRPLEYASALAGFNDA